MEIFVDGGLFELIIGIALAYAINYIFLKKYLLIIFSVVAVAAPFALFFIRTGELYGWIVSLCIVNGVFLVLLLWRQRLQFPKQSLIDVDRLKKIISVKRKSLFHQKRNAY